MARLHREKKKKQFEGAWQTDIRTGSQQRDRSTVHIGLLSDGQTAGMGLEDANLSLCWLSTSLHRRQLFAAFICCYCLGDWLLLSVWKRIGYSQLSRKTHIAVERQATVHQTEMYASLTLQRMVLQWPQRHKNDLVNFVTSILDNADGKKVAPSGRLWYTHTVTQYTPGRRSDLSEYAYYSFACCTKLAGQWPAVLASHSEGNGR